MPSFETDVVLRALIEDGQCPMIGPSWLGPTACAEFADKLGVSKEQLWGAICNLREQKRIEDIRSPNDYRFVHIVPTTKGEAYFNSASHKQPYPRERCHHRRISSPAQPANAFITS